MPARSRKNSEEEIKCQQSKRSVIYQIKATSWRVNLLCPPTNCRYVPRHRFSRLDHRFSCLHNHFCQWSSHPRANCAWIIAIVTLVSTILYSVYFTGKMSQLPILCGLVTGYLVAVVIGQVTGIPFVNFNTVESAISCPDSLGVLQVPTTGRTLAPWLSLGISPSLS